jgi:hypothetical protein
VWTYILGPILVLTPRRWREEHLARFPVRWHRAALLSGIIETIVSLPLVFIWHDFFLTRFIAIYQRSGASADVPGAYNRIGALEYILFLLNPITWLVGYSIFEGIVRAVAAISTGEAYGTFFLAIVEHMHRWVTRPLARKELPLVRDELLAGSDTCDLRIASCRKKPEWKYPYTIRYAGAFFQVVGDTDFGVGPRPYVYLLRRLPPGERAGGLKAYDPEDILFRT